MSDGTRLPTSSASWNAGVDSISICYEVGPFITNIGPLKFTFLGRAFPIVRMMVPIAPDKIVKRLYPAMGGFLDFKAHLETQVSELMKDPSSLDRSDYNTVYHHLMTSQPNKGHETPSKKSLIEEAVTMNFAGMLLSLITTYTYTTTATSFSRKRHSRQCVFTGYFSHLQQQKHSISTCQRVR